MKILGFMNGWKDCPHCWRNYLFRPFKIDHTPVYSVISIFGFAFFIDFNRE